MKNEKLEKNVPSHQGYDQPLITPTTPSLEITLPSSGTHPSTQFLQTRMEQLDLGQNDAIVRIHALEREVGEIKEKVGELATLVEPTAITELRDIPYRDAKKLIVEYFEGHHGEEIDPADIQDALGIDVLTASRICEELEKEGKIRTT
jgi:hypothetical protein